MPDFRFKAVDPYGRVVEGETSASTRALATSDLEARSFLPISIEEQGAGAVRLGFGRRRARGEDLTGMTEDLAALLSAGVSLVGGLGLLAASSPPAIAALVSSLRAEVSGGMSFAQALAKSSHFPPSYVEMVRAAEVAGTLGETLATLARERRRSAEIRSRIASALAYPLFLVVAAGGVLIFVLVSVIPSFEQALSGLGSGGGANGFVFALSRFARENGAALLALAACAAGLAVAALRSPSARLGIWRLVAGLPVLRTLVLYHRTLVFCGTLAMLLRSRVEISTSLRLIRDMMQGKDGPLRHETVLSGLRGGEKLTDSLARVDLLPLQAVHMLKVGEEMGDLAEASARVASAYDTKFTRALDRATGILGPVILLLVSALVAWIIVSVMTALLKINEALL